MTDQCTGPVPVQQHPYRFFGAWGGPVLNRWWYWTVPVQNGPVRITRPISHEITRFNSLIESHQSKFLRFLLLCIMCCHLFLLFDAKVITLNTHKI